MGFFDRFKAAPRKLDLAALENDGFFRWVAANERDELTQKLTGATDLHDLLTALADEGGGATHRVYGLDVESLAEQGTLDFLGRLAPVLRAAGVKVEATYAERVYPASAHGPGGRGAPKLTDDGWLAKQAVRVAVKDIAIARRPGETPAALTYGDEGNVLLVGEDEIPLRTLDGERAADAWGCALYRTMELVDGALAAHGSAERTAAWYVGMNTTFLVLGAPSMTQQLDAIARTESQRLMDREKVRRVAVKPPTGARYP